jgi:hypothetical protein
MRLQPVHFLSDGHDAPAQAKACGYILKSKKDASCLEKVMQYLSYDH